MMALTNVAIFGDLRDLQRKSCLSLIDPSHLFYSISAFRCVSFVSDTAHRFHIVDLANIIYGRYQIWVNFIPNS